MMTRKSSFIGLVSLVTLLGLVSLAGAANELFLSTDTAESEVTYVIQFEATVKGNIDKIRVTLPPGANAANASLGRVMVGDKDFEGDDDHKKDVQLSLDGPDTLIIDLKDDRRVKVGTKILVELFNLNNPVAGINHAIDVTTVNKNGNVLEVIPPIAYSTFFVGTGDITGVIAGTGLSGGGTSGDVTLSNTGVLSVTGGTGISITGGSGNFTITNTGDTNTADDITSLTAGTGISITGSGNSRTISATATGITGSGTANTIAKFTGATAIGNSAIVETGGNVGIGTTAPGAKLEVAGQVKITGGTPTAGKVLTSDAGGLATWEPAPGAGGGMLNNIVIFTSNGTWTKPAGVTKVRVRLVGAGGGGTQGGVASSGEQFGAGGGGAGGYCENFVDVTSVSSVTVTVGAGGVTGTGAGGPITPGTAGGPSSFGIYCSATGGGGGHPPVSGGGAGGGGGIGSSGIINFTGGGGSGASGGGGGGGSGGSSFFGGGGSGGGSTTNFTGGTGNAGGGGGGGLGFGGGSGGSGVIIIEEYK